MMTQKTLASSGDVLYTEVGILKNLCYPSLVSLGDYKDGSSLMGKLVGSRLFIETFVEWMMYRSLYKMHLCALHGYSYVVVDTAANSLMRQVKSRVVR
jgi:NADH:ubiquinone reductase (H+-translocating)